MKYILISITILINIISCKKNEHKNNYYVISAQDSIRRSKHLPPFPPALPGLKYYSNIVFIFDSTERIYLYHTELQDSNGHSLDKTLGQTWCCEEEEFPFFLNLEPDDLIRFDDDYFMDFLKDNNSIFQLDSNFTQTERFAYFVSESDTIKNKAFYELTKYIDDNNKLRRRVFYKVRNTTEEEHNVLNCKKTGNKYDPTKFQWSENYLDGLSKPLTKRYDSLENLKPMKIKKKKILKYNSLEIGRFL